LEKIKSFDQLKEINNKLKNNNSQNNIVLAVGMATCGIAAGAREVLNKFNEEIALLNIKNVSVLSTGCLGYCYAEPLVEVRMPNGSSILYANVDAKKAKQIIDEHIVIGNIVSDFQLNIDNKSNIRIALRNCGVINPESIEEYIAKDGYMALSTVLSQNPNEVIEIIKKSGLRGRGGGGFPTGIKWESARKSQSEKKYVVCNADEGDPGAFMDRSILEGDPHSVLEAMAIAGYCIGANEGIIYIRAEYPLAVRRLKSSITIAEELGLLGENILGTDFSFKISLSLGAGAFVCGEETALIASIEGNRGEPTIKPPFPTTSGLWHKPTCINNVETFANICPIILKGSDWFCSIGTEKSKGTKVFALAGKINNVGLIEIPMGTTLREIIYNIGGGIKDNRAFKAAQTGGPSGGCIPSQFIDTPIDYDSLTAIGSMMGSGGLIVMDQDNCMVDIAKFFLEFTVDESCGKCPPCRIGTKRMFEILERITGGKGENGDIEQLEGLAKNIAATALCGLGKTSPNPVLSTLKYFRNEYEEHIYEKKCSSKVCKSLIKFRVIDDLCKKCGICAKNCSVNAIKGDKNTPYVIDTSKCIGCGVCLTKCPFEAIEKC